MNFNNIEEIEKAGFIGFTKMSELFLGTKGIPKIKGVYFVLYLDEKPPTFLSNGAGPKLYKKKTNPNVSLAELKSNWVENTIVVYIGKAGGTFQGKESKETLRSRLQTYFSFGKGKDVSHFGGRLIWQLENYKDLIVCWQPTLDNEPAVIETNLIAEFKKKYNQQRPFANLKD